METPTKNAVKRLPWPRITLGTKLAVVVLICVLVAMVAVAGFFLHQMQKEADAKARSIATDSADNIADRIKDVFDKSFAVVSSTNESLIALWSHDVRDRRIGDILLKHILDADSDRFGAWVVFKPNAFDGRDKDFVNAPNSDATGRYLSYWHQNGMEVTLDKVQGYESSDSPLFQTPMVAGAAHLSEPYFIRSNDRNILTVSYAEPILADDKGLGAIGIDVALSSLDDTIAGLTLPKDAKVTLLSHAGFVVATNDAVTIHRPVGEGRPGLVAEFQRIVRSGPAYVTIETPQGPLVRSWHAITFNSLKAPWYVLSEIPIRSYQAGAQREQRVMVLMTVGALVCMMVAILFAIRAMVTRPLATIERFITTLRDENGPQGCSETDRTDEIGAIAKTLVAFKAAELENGRLRRAEDEREMRFVAVRRRELGQLADQLARSVQAVALAVEKTSRNIMRRAEMVSATAVVSADRTRVIADASSMAQRSVGAVDDATLALRQSIDGIAAEMSHASRIASATADQAVTSMVVTDELAARASRIGEIVALITGIASRTNMLALNATIEAARAGEAGRGFAVVAQEVKALAAQTTEATVEIERQIKAMQASATNAAQTLTSIGGTVSEINTISIAIVAAVRAQGEATARIGRSVEEAVSASKQVNAAIEHVDRATSQTGDAAADMLIETATLTDESARLHDEVIDFITKIRAA